MAIPAGIEIQELQDDGEFTLKLKGELDMAGVPSLEATIERICADGAGRLTLDLGELSFIDSTGLAAIVHANGLCGKRGCAFLILPGPRPVQRLFEVTGLDGVLPFA